MCQSDVRFAMIRLHDFIYSFTQRVGYLATVCFVIQLFHFGRGSLAIERQYVSWWSIEDSPLFPGYISILHFLQTKNCSRKTKFFLPIKESGRILVQVLKFATHFEEQYIICNTNFGLTQILVKQRKRNILLWVVSTLLNSFFLLSASANQYCLT